MDLKILQIAANTKNNKEIKNFTHKSKYKSHYVVMRWKLA